MSEGQGNITFNSLNGGGGSSAPIIITPAQIVADQNDYNPAGFATATVVRISGDNGIRAITSFVATTDGNQKKLINVGTFPIYFPGEHTGGAAANRISAPGDILFFPGQSLELYYDGVISRWQIDDPDLKTNLIKGPYYNVSYGTPTTGDWGEVFFLGSLGGSIPTQSPATTSLPGTWLLSTGPGAAGAMSHMGFTKSSGPTTNANYSSFSGAHQLCEALLFLPQLSVPAGIDEFQALIQLTNGPAQGSYVNNSISIIYDSVVTPNWILESKDNAGVTTQINSGVLVVINTLYRLKICINKANTEARYYINDISVGRITTNLPISIINGAKCLIRKFGAAVNPQNFNINSMKATAIYS